MDLEFECWYEDKEEDITGDSMAVFIHDDNMGNKWDYDYQQILYKVRGLDNKFFVLHAPLFRDKKCETVLTVQDWDKDTINWLEVVAERFPTYKILKQFSFEDIDKIEMEFWQG